MFKITDEMKTKAQTLFDAIMTFGVIAFLIMFAGVFGWIVVQLFIDYTLLAFILMGIGIAIVGIRWIYKILSGRR